MKKNNKNLGVYIGATVSLVLILYCIVYIYNYYSANDILWHYPKNYELNERLNPKKLSPSEIGNSIGGILTPIIGLVASVLTFLAFYMQKKANDVIQEQFKIQQFESQFYEMLHLHKENVNEITTRKISDGVLVEKRAAFEGMVQDFNNLLACSTTFLVLGKVEYDVSYKIFFWGYSNEEIEKLSPPTQQFIKDNNTHKFRNIANLFNHKGYSSFLGHYFRHLFLMVKFVVENDIVTEYQEKMKYLKLLRAQLSNYEQIALFYNWLSGYGAAWENEENHYFTDYKMIHNLWDSELYHDQYIVDKVNSLIDKYNKNPKKTPLFEFQEDDFNLKMNDIQNTSLSNI